MASIRRNKQAMSALLADYKTMNGDASLDGITAEQENKHGINEATSNEVRYKNSLFDTLTTSKTDIYITATVFFRN